MFVVISVWTTTVFVMTVESDYSVKYGALRLQQKIIIIIINVIKMY